MASPVIEAPPLHPVDCLLIWSPAEPEGPLWWQLVKRWLVDPKLGHVAVAFFDPAGPAWVVVNAVFGGIVVRALPPAFGPREVLAQFPGKTAWAMLPAVRRDFVTYIPRGVITCVSVAKAVTGLRGWCITPQGLYRQIERMSADAKAEGRQERGEGAEGGGQAAES